MPDAGRFDARTVELPDGTRLTVAYSSDLSEKYDNMTDEEFANAVSAPKKPVAADGE